MKESTVTRQLAMHWVPVVDADGRTRMEAQWYVVGETAATAHAA